MTECKTRNALKALTQDRNKKEARPWSQRLSNTLATLSHIEGIRILQKWENLSWTDALILPKIRSSLNVAKHGTFRKDIYESFHHLTVCKTSRWLNTYSNVQDFISGPETVSTESKVGCSCPDMSKSGRHQHPFIIWPQNDNITRMSSKTDSLQHAGLRKWVRFKETTCKNSRIFLCNLENVQFEGRHFALIWPSNIVSHISYLKQGIWNIFMQRTWLLIMMTAIAWDTVIKI